MFFIFEEKLNIIGSFVNIELAMTRAANQSIPLITNKTRLSNKPYAPDPEEIHINTLLSKATRQYKKFPTEDNLKSLRTLQTETKAELKQAKNRSFNSYCNKLSNLPYSQLWKEIKKLQPIPHNPTPQNLQDKANQLITDFAKRGDPSNLSKTTRDLLANQENLYLQFIHKAAQQESPTDSPITMQELHTVLDPKKDTSPGVDKIPYSLYKNLPNNFKKLVLHLVNQSFNKSEIPQTWKTGKIIPIPKPDNKGYRPIALLPTISKLTEAIMANRINSSIKLPDFMYGFRSERGTTDALTHLLSIITNRNGSKHHKRVAVFLDLEKAFERANHTSILYSLTQKGITGKILKWVQSFLWDRHNFVSFQGHHSQYYKFNTGVPQGSTLSPTLFNVLMSSLLEDIDNQHITTIVYADDIALVTNSTDPQNTLQKALDKLEINASSLGLQFSPTKTKVVSFNNRAKINLTLQGATVDQVKSHKYLGIILDNNLTFTPHKRYLTDQISSRINFIKYLSGRLNGINTQQLLTLYKAITYGIINYSAPVLVLLKPKALQPLDATIRSGLRICLGLPRNANSEITYLESNTIPLHSHVNLSNIKYVIRNATQGHTTPAVQAVQEHLHRVHLPHQTKVYKPPWQEISAKFQKSLDIPIITSPSHTPIPPYLNSGAKYHTHHTINKKENPQLAAQQANYYIENTFPSNATHLYTDASSQNNGKVAAAAYLDSNTHKTLKLSNNTPITLAELHGINLALAIIKNLHPKVYVIHTDSLSAINILDKNTKTYRFITSQINKAVTQLTAKSFTIHINWIPSHTGIEKNDIVDALANQATLSDNPIYITEQTPGHYLHKLSAYKNAVYTYLHNNIQNKTWYRFYKDSSISTIQTISPRNIDTQSRLLRTSQYTHNFKSSKPLLCRTCNVPHNPIHHLFDCSRNYPHTLDLRSKIPNFLLDHSYHDQAAYILRLTQLIPNTLLPLVKHNPYSFLNTDAISDPPTS